MSNQAGFAPRETFLEILKWMPICTFDLIIKYGDQGIILVKRKIEPYNKVWALPGLRKLKGESLDETFLRIAKEEVGLDIDPTKRRLIGQYLGQFEEDNQREDVSTCYLFQVDSSQKIAINSDHFSELLILRDSDPIPEPIGEMYRYYLEIYRRDRL